MQVYNSVFIILSFVVAVSTQEVYYYSFRNIVYYPVLLIPQYCVFRNFMYSTILFISENYLFYYLVRHMPRAMTNHGAEQQRNHHLFMGLLSPLFACY